jgi:SAM-dependent methyltransferase
VREDAERRDVQRRSRERFGLTAERYAASGMTARFGQVTSLLALLAPSAGDAVLDVACGPGSLLAALAPRVRLAAGVDLTPEMLRLARAQALPAGSRPLRLVRGEAEALPFRDGAFSIVTTTSAIHHYANPGAVVAEMARVCRRGGRVGIADLVGPADEEKRALQNEIERLRDPSHVEVLSEAGLEALLSQAGLEIEGRAAGALSRELGEWCAIARTPPEVVRRVRAMLLATQPGDRAGLAPEAAGEEVRFRHQWVNLVARKP